MLGTLLVIVLECIVMAGIAYTLKYTVTNRSGLNEPEKLQRIWSRSEEIRFQPVFKSMIFSILVAHGAPAIFSFVCSFAFAMLGLPDGVFHQIQEVLSLLVMFVCAAIGPIIYRAGGGNRTMLNVMALLAFNMVMIYLLIFQAVNDLSKSPRFKDSSGVVWLTYLFTPIFLTGLQVPFAMWGAAREFSDTTTRIYSSNTVPDWVRLNKTILLAAAPLTVTRIVTLCIHYSLGRAPYLSRIAYLLADAMMFAVAGLSAVISVNRALLAEDFRWQWRSFLTPAIPLGICDFLIAIFSSIFKENGHFMTRTFLTIQHLCIYGSVGALGAYLYLFLAEKYAQDQLTDYNHQEVGDEIFDDTDEDNQLEV